MATKRDGPSLAVRRWTVKEIHRLVKAHPRYKGNFAAFAKDIGIKGKWETLARKFIDGKVSIASLHLYEMADKLGVPMEDIMRRPPRRAAEKKAKEEQPENVGNLKEMYGPTYEFSDGSQVAINTIYEVPIYFKDRFAVITDMGTRVEFFRSEGNVKKSGENVTG